MAEREHRHSLQVRLWHWLTALLFIVLILTGISLHFSGRDFSLINYRLAVTLHDYGGIALAVLYVLYLIYLFATGYWRQYIPAARRLPGRLATQIRVYLRLMAHGNPPVADVRRGREPHHALQHHKVRFNALQQLTYVLVMFGLLPTLIVSGLIYLYYPSLVPQTVLGAAGLWPVAVAHYALSILGTVYFIIHIGMATTNYDTRARFRLMITGRTAPKTDNGASDDH